MRILLSVSFLMLVGVAHAEVCLAQVHLAQVHLAQGCFSGEVTATTALLQTRLTAIAGPELDESQDVPGAEGVVSFEYGTHPELTDGLRTPAMAAMADKDFIVRTKLTGLAPGTTYFFRPIFGASEANSISGEICQFQTLAGPHSDAAVRFCVGSCMNYNKFLYGRAAKSSGPLTATEEDKRLGFPAFVAMAALQPDFFVGTGDIVYYDNILNGPAETLPELRKCWHQQFRFPRLIDFFARTATYWSKDDHDFRFDDADRRGDRLPPPQTGIELFREQMPIHAPDDADSPTYRTHRINRDLQIWLSEGRDYRSPNTLEDGPEKTLWGAEQKQWLQRTLLESDATWKILISPTPMVGPDDARKKDNHTNLGGFRHEADEFFSWLNQNDVSNFMTFCGDRHWQYHSIHPSGIEEFACGALNDENSRVGVKPGAKNGTDPEGLIEQPYTYPEPTGGFLHVSVESRSPLGSHLTIEFRDATGSVLHRVLKTQTAP